MLLRKGAISAKAEERVIIPINMKDGVLLGTGKGNKEWNCSAPHGSGRKLRRDEVKNKYTVSVLLLHTGMRCGEMLALRWRDVDFENGLLKIEKSQSMAKNRDRGDDDNKYIAVEGTTKNEKAREIRLMDEAMKMLKIIKNQNPYSTEDDFVCVAKTGKVNTATNLEHRMAVIFKNAGLMEYTGALHIFRRTFATRMFEDGARMEDIAAYIGDLVSTTEKYYVAIRKKVKLRDKTKHIVELPKKQMTDNKVG